MTRFSFILTSILFLFLSCSKEERIASPNLVTLEIREITSNFARGGGHIYGDGNREITARGIVWSTGSLPTLELNTGFTSEEPGMGTFSSYMTDLENRVQYFVRAYAVNSEGTAYGEEISFTTACEDIYITHISDSVAPQSKTVTYRTVKSSLTGEPKCWIIQNLGAEHPAKTANDNSPEAAGWYWQFNNKQAHIPGSNGQVQGAEWITGIDENSDWLFKEDPCAILLGSEWRLPTAEEWEAVHKSDGWNSSRHTFESELRLHTAGLLEPGDGSLTGRGSYGAYWTGSQYNDTFGKYLYFYGGTSTMFHYAFSSYTKSTGMPLRCLTDRLY